MVKECPCVAGYGYPSRAAASCRTSLLRSVERFREIPEPAGLRAAAVKAADNGARCTPPAWVSGGLPTFRDICDALIEVNPDANSGYPYSLTQMKKLEFSRENVADVAALVQMRMKLLMVTPVEEIESMTPVELVQRGFTDCMAVIEKNEPHKLKKLQEGRPRNVICGSVIDETIDRLLYGKLNKAQIDEWGEVPSCIGLGFTQEGVDQIFTAMMYLAFESQGRRLATSDVRAFEFSLQKWTFRGDWIARCRAMGVDESHWYADLMWKRFLCLMNSVFVFTDGVMWAQRVKGWQKSGTLVTSSSNTRARELDAYLVGAEAVRAAGDDAAETAVEDAVAKYAAIGVELKEYKLCDADKFEFCSHLFERGRPPVPLNAGKSFYKLCCEVPTEGKIRQVVGQFFHAPEFEGFLESFVRHYRPAAKHEFEPV